MRQLIRRAVPEQGSYTVYSRPELRKNYSYALIERRESVSAGFRKVTVRLAEGLEAQVIPLLTACTPDGDCSRNGLVSPVPEEADASVMGVPPNSFYMDMSWLVESLISSTIISEH